MPDWIVHIAFALILAVLFKIKDWKFLIAGTLLPDLSRVLIILLPFFGESFFQKSSFDQIKTFLILEPIHTPFISLLLALTISLIFNNSKKIFLITGLGVLSHFLLDILQFAGAFGPMLLYPFYIKEFSLNLFYSSILIFPIIGIILSLLFLKFLKEKNKIQFNKKFYSSLIPLIIVLIFLFSTQSTLLENNIYGTGFLSYPEKYENKEISLYDSKIVSLNPLTLEEMGKIFKLETKENLKLNSQITIKGIYRENKISVENIFFNNNNKLYFSLLGLIFYIYLIFKK